MTERGWSLGHSSQQTDKLQSAVLRPHGWSTAAASLGAAKSVLVNLTDLHTGVISASVPEGKLVHGRLPLIGGGGQRSD